LVSEGSVIPVLHVTEAQWPWWYLWSSTTKLW